MAYFLSSEMIAQMMSVGDLKLVPAKQNLGTALIAKWILMNVDAKRIRVEDGVMILCDNEIYRTYEFHPESERQKAAEGVKAEIKEYFGLDSEVDFSLEHSEDELPDSPPPKFWGGPDTVYFYTLTVKVKL